MTDSFDECSVPYAILAARLHAFLRLAIATIETHLYLAPALDEDAPAPIIERSLTVVYRRAHDRRPARFQDLAGPLGLMPIVHALVGMDQSLARALLALTSLHTRTDADESDTGVRPGVEDDLRHEPPSSPAEHEGSPVTAARDVAWEDFVRVVTGVEESLRFAESVYGKADREMRAAEADQRWRIAREEFERSAGRWIDLPVLHDELEAARQERLRIAEALPPLRELAANLAARVAAVRPADQMLVRGGDVYDVVIGSALEKALDAALQALPSTDPEAPGRDWRAFAAAFERSLARATEGPADVGKVDPAELRDTVHRLAPSMDDRVRRWVRTVSDRLADETDRATVRLAAACLAAEVEPHSAELAARLRVLTRG
ncbi:hypothetical protein [Spirillospora sp. NPDC047279]|uniref:hypothetical protein n=1 Tax=Spirillospora sp. NPDC047279 TaxID=3155478 RepID=UPI0034059993